MEKTMERTDLLSQLVTGVFVTGFEGALKTFSERVATKGFSDAMVWYGRSLMIEEALELRFSNIRAALRLGGPDKIVATLRRVEVHFVRIMVSPYFVDCGNSSGDLHRVREKCEHIAVAKALEKVREVLDEIAPNPS